MPRISDLSSSVACGFPRSSHPENAGRKITEEVMFYGTWILGSTPGGDPMSVKTLAIRLEEEQHAQLAMIAQLEELTVTDAIRQAIEQWVESRRSNPELQRRAEAILADIDREAATRRGAIAAFISGDAPSAGAKGSGTTSRRSSRSKGGDAASE
jgi:hypothetical protein